MSVVTIYAGILGLWLVILSMRVIALRRGGGTSLGDGGNEQLQRRIRAQGNLTEYTPIALILLFALETAQISDLLLHALGSVLVVARLLHGWALSFTANNSFGRFWGTLLTFIMIGTASILCVLAFAGMTF